MIVLVIILVWNPAEVVQVGVIWACRVYLLNAVVGRLWTHGRRWRGDDGEVHEDKVVLRPCARCGGKAASLKWYPGPGEGGGAYFCSQACARKGARRRRVL